VRERTDFIAERGKLRMIVSDNGIELKPNVILAWTGNRGRVASHHGGQADADLPLQREPKSPKRHKPEEIIGKLRGAEIVLAQGGTKPDACRRITVAQQTYYRWRKEYGDLKTDEARRMKDLGKENLRLRRAISDLTLDKLILQGAASGPEGQAQLNF
jgi:transposase-like protein